MQKSKKKNRKYKKYTQKY